MITYLTVAFSIALAVSGVWIFFESRTSAVRLATIRAKRGTPKSIGGSVSLHGRIAIPTAYRVKRSRRSTARG